MNSANGILPVPSSLLRKTNGKRLSMASATRSSMMGTNPNLRPSNNFLDNISVSSIPSSIKRRSYISTPGRNSRRRTPLYSSQGTQSQSQTQTQNSSQTRERDDGYSQQSVFNNVSATPSQISDLRPLRDRQYQNLIQGEIYEFLRLNKFEIEMNHPLSTKTLKQPTQKDFILIFQFLYNKLDPNYKFTKSIETEVFNILKLLNYPYLDGINRSQISAVGGTYWPTFLAMLYWLVKVNLQVTDLDLVELENKSYDDILNDLHEQYITGLFLNTSSGDELQILDKFKTSCQEIRTKISGDIEAEKLENEKLIARFDELDKEAKVYENHRKKGVALENDLVKFKAYIDTMKHKKNDWYRILDEIQAEIDNYRKSSDSLKQDIIALENNLKAKGLDIDTINKLNNERNDLAKKIDVNNDKIEEVTIQLQQKQIDLKNRYESLDNFLRHYNDLVYKIQFKNVEGVTDHNFEIKLNDTIWDLSRSFNQAEILQQGKNLKQEKLQLIKLKNTINGKIHEVEDSKIKDQEETDSINESIIEQRDQLESLVSTFAINKANYASFHASVSDKSTTYATKIEKLRREIKTLQVDADADQVAIIRKQNEVSTESATLNVQISKDREALHNNVLFILENTLNFKENIHQNLEDLEELVTREKDTDHHH